LNFARTAFLWIAVASSSHAPAADQHTDAVGQFVQAEMKKQQIPGLALLVSHQGHAIRAEGFGLSNVELKVPTRPESIFQMNNLDPEAYLQ
jgi:CubicO group peptidase (beta-lactamase class C family)